MWSLKFKVREKWNIYNKRCAQFNVSVYFYSHNYYEEENKIFYVGSGVVEGKEKDKKRFFVSLKKDKKVKHLEANKDFFVCIYSELKTSERAKYVAVAYNPKLIFLKPTFFDNEGWEHWELACAEKKSLDKFILILKEYDGEHVLHYLKKAKLDNVMIYAMMPKLSSKQQEATRLAVSQGYYGYPRKTTLEKLAKIMKISTSTFQFHLAKAEAKLLPFVMKKQK